MTHALLFQSHLPNIFLAYSFSHSTFIIDRLPLNFLNYNSSFTLLYIISLDYLSTRVFKCLIFAYSFKHYRTKLDLRSRKCVYLCYKPGDKWHILYDLKNKQIFLSRDTCFYETIFSYTTITPPKNNNTLPLYDPYKRNDILTLFHTPILTRRIIFILWIIFFKNKIIIFIKKKI